MTCIVGIAENGVVTIGGDSAAIDSNYNLVLRRDEKVFRNGEFVIGFTSSYRMGQVLRFLKFPDHPEGMDAFEFMVTRVVDAIRTALRTAGFSKKESEVDTGGTFLVGYRGRLFLIADDFQVEESRAQNAACGCAAQAALGSLFTSGELNECTPRDRVRIALSVAERLSAGVRAPFIVLETEKQSAEFSAISAAK
jgi:hypothetical protein